MQCCACAVSLFSLAFISLLKLPAFRSMPTDSLSLVCVCVRSIPRRVICIQFCHICCTEVDCTVYGLSLEHCFVCFEPGNATGSQAFYLFLNWVIEIGEMHACARCAAVVVITDDSTSIGVAVCMAKFSSVIRPSVELHRRFYAKLIPCELCREHKTTF